MTPRARLLRFGLVGLVNTGIDLGLYVGLRSVGVGLLGANAVSTTAGLLFSFAANGSFTFGDRAGGSRLRTAALFLLTTGVGLWVLQPLVIAGVGHLLRTWGAGDWWPAVPVLALAPKLAGIAVGVVWNYLAYDRLVFRVAGSRGHEPERARELVG
ncbi:Putative flippase GtrA (transmembrane translocase of bactoprenol-linked glucose) [Geodermatophilus telluris]|uniref:Putative flippase GtrA (Transmembrane translocase of bactoprenol-linked glucose) n=1 Tax=Geodermatophilus telluris TaxID=1190417 RepID=A0A1G6IKR2_9ACTN|nr:GtrA family protein [Geodermatophilus telluris]SDC07054.1 Putative flippase GtrA (transmembrane translocase of bactoprenol-linked glucose) [Geodermatophilus telluris]